MTFEISKGKICKAKKILIYAPEGIGKSTLASQFPNPLFIDTEGGTNSLDVARLPAPSSWTMLKDEVQYVINNPDICKTLVLDTADWAERMEIEEICAKNHVDGLEGFGWGKGYTYAAEEFGRLLDKLSELVEKGVNVVVTAHAQLKKIELPEEMGSYDHWETKLSKKAAPLLKEWADSVFFGNYKTVVINVDGQGSLKGKNKAQGGTRVMYTTHTPFWDAKNRDGLPDELPFSYEAIAHTIDATPVETAQRATSKPQEVQEPQQRAQAAATAEQNNRSKEAMADPNSNTTTTPPPAPPAASPSTPSNNESAKPDNPPEQMTLDLSNPHEQVQASTPPPSGEGQANAMPPTGEGQAGQGGAVLPPESNATLPPEGRKDPPLPDSRIPKALRDLMIANKVTEWDIQDVVQAKGYFPSNMNIWDYDPDFIDGCLVGAWDEVYSAVKEMWEKEEIPFN